MRPRSRRCCSRPRRSSPTAPTPPTRPWRTAGGSSRSHQDRARRPRARSPGGSEVLEPVVQLLDAFALPCLVIQAQGPLPARLVEAHDIAGFRRRDPFVDRLDPLFDMILVTLEHDGGTVEDHPRRPGTRGGGGRPAWLLEAL